MARIAHLGDLHLRHDNRFDETLRCLDFAIEDAIVQDVDLFVIPGDIFDTKSTPVERNAFASRVCRMAGHAPMVIARGNHDKPGDLEIFGALETKHTVAVHELPAVDFLGGVRVFSLPHFDKSTAAGALPSDLSIEKSDELMTEAIRHTLDGWKAQLEDPDDKTPAIQIGHLTVTGSQLSNGETMAAHGIQLNIGDLDIGFDANMENHIHRAQPCDSLGRIWYAGSISRANFGEDKDPKGYLLWTIEEHGAEPRAEFREIPAREMITFDASYDPELGWDDPIYLNGISGSEVRLRITVPENRRADAEVFAADARGRLESAHDVQIEIRTIPVTRVRSEEIATAQTNEDKLKAYWIAAEAPPEGEQEEILALLKEIQTEVA